MSELDALEKTNRVNLLFDFYEALLTEKQGTFLKLYFHDNYSLGEIAAEFEISRQAVYERIKRAETTLLDYEHKLGLLAKHGERLKQVAEVEELLSQLDLEETKEIRRRVRQIVNID